MIQSSSPRPGHLLMEVLTPVELLRQEYNGKIADVWSVGVSLYVLLTGTFPFKRPDDSKANNVRCQTSAALCRIVAHSCASARWQRVVWLECVDCPVASALEWRAVRCAFTGPTHVMSRWSVCRGRSSSQMVSLTAKTYRDSLKSQLHLQITHMLINASCTQVVRLQRMFIRIINADFTPVPGLTAECRDLLARLLNPDPKARITVTEALQHPWVRPGSVH